MNKYFNDIDLSRAEVAKVDALIANTVNSLFGTLNGTVITFFEQDLKTAQDYTALINNIITEAFENNTDNINKCKALFAIYISGLDLNQSNLFGLIKLLLTAIRSCGSLLDVDIYYAYKKYLNEIKHRHIEPKTVGSISKCNFLGDKIDFDANDKFANANDERYSARVQANVDDYDKSNNIGYKSKMNAHRRIEAEAKKRAQSNEKFKKAIDMRIKKAGVDKNGVPNLSREKATEMAIDSYHKLNYDNWLQNNYNTELEDYKKNRELQANQASDIIDEDFD